MWLWSLLKILQSCQDIHPAFTGDSWVQYPGLWPIFPCSDKIWTLTSLHLWWLSWRHHYTYIPTHDNLADCLTKYSHAWNFKSLQLIWGCHSDLPTWGGGGVLESSGKGHTLMPSFGPSLWTYESWFWDPLDTNLPLSCLSHQAAKNLV